VEGRGRIGWRGIAMLSLVLAALSIASPGHAGLSAPGTAGKPATPKLEPPSTCNSCPCSPTQSGPDPKCPCDGAAVADGDPVMLFNGAFVHERTDLVVNGVVPIEVIRRYDSSSSYDSPVGYGWSLNFDVRLYDVGTEIVVRTRCGGQDRYVEPPGTGAAVAAPANPARGSVPRLERLDNGLYVVSYQGGSRAFFDDRGRLEFLENPQGNRLHLTYTSADRQPLIGSSPYGVDTSAPQVVAKVYQLSRVAEELFDRGVSTPVFVATGRYVDFGYDGNGRLSTASSSDGRVVTYVHDTVSGGTTTKGNLTQVQGLVGLVDAYGYTDPNDVHDLTSLLEGQGAGGGSPPVAPVVLTYANDRVATETLGQSLWTFQYPTTEDWTRTVVRRVVNAAGTHNATTKYTFNASGFVVQRIDPDGTKYDFVRTPAPPPAPPTPSDTFVDQIQVSRPNGAGGYNVVRTTSLGYDGEHRTSRSVQVVPGSPGVTRTESWEYDGEWLKAHQLVQSDQPQRIFRTEYSFYRSGLHDGQPGYSATAPITNIYQIQRAVTSPGGVPSYEVTTLEYDRYGQLARVTPPALATSPDNFAIVRSYYDLSDPNVGTRAMLAGIHLEAGAALPELQRSFSYDARGFLHVLTDARSHTTTFGWDDRGRLTRVTNDLTPAESVLLTYGAPNASNPASVQPGAYLIQIERGSGPTQSEDQIERRLVDARGFLVGVQRKNDDGVFESFATYAYDSDGNRLRALDGRGELHSWTYDDLGRALTFSDHVSLWNGSGNPPAALHTTSFENDAFGDRTKVTDDKGRVTDLAYDGANRVLSVTQEGGGDAPSLQAPLLTAFEYDAAGNVTKVTDPKLQATIYSYDLLSRLGSVQQPGSETVSYLYDARSRLAKTTNARGQDLVYGYFPFGGLETVLFDADHDGLAGTGERTLSYTYDPNGNVTSTKDTAFLTSAQAGGGLPAGRLFSFTYDARNRLDTTTAHYIAGAPVMDARYDAFGQRDELVLADGQTLRHQWHYDLQGRVVAACLPQDATTDPCTATGATKKLGFMPLADDKLGSIAHENGLVTTLAYEDFGPVHSIGVSGASAQQLVYGYDELLNVSSIAETQNGTAVSPSFGFGYDAVYRLTGATYPANLDLPSSESFGYDAAGNRDDDPSNPTPWAYDSDNRLTKSPGLSARCYDADGNQTSTRSSGDCATGTIAQSFGWDAQNRMTSFSEGSTSASYAYDPFGRRIEKTVNGTTTFYLWDGDRLLAEYDGSGNRQVRYAYVPGFAPVQVAYKNGASESIYDVHSDHLDTPRMLTASPGQTVSWRASYEAFGRAHVSTDPDGSSVTPDPQIQFNLRFPGQYFDAESGLHYNRFRYYDASTGRYISADPIGQFALLTGGGRRLGAASQAAPSILAAPGSRWALGLANGNPYWYAAGNPLVSLDPLGLISLQVGPVTVGYGRDGGFGEANAGDWGLSVDLYGDAPVHRDDFPEQPVPDDATIGYSHLSEGVEVQVGPFIWGHSTGEGKAITDHADPSLYGQQGVNYSIGCNGDGSPPWVPRLTWGFGFSINFGGSATVGLSGL